MKLQVFRDDVRDALDREEGLAVAPDAGAEGVALIRIICQRQALRDEAFCDLEQPPFRISRLLVPRDGAQHGCRKGGPHDRKILVDRIQDRDRLPPRIIRR